MRYLSLFSGIEAASALGNSMAVPVIRWIGKQIDAAEMTMREAA